MSGGAIFLSITYDYICESIGGTADDYSLFQGNYVSQYMDASATYSSYANANGGAIRNDAIWIDQITYCNFIDNYVESPGSAYGGAISNYYDGGTIYNGYGIGLISDVNFEGNKAIASNEINGDHGYGGAIYNNLSIDEIVRTKFIANEATHGGAIYNEGYIYLENAYFVNNIASVAGGAIYNAANGIMEIVDTDSSTTFSGNTANDQANAIHNDGALYLYVTDDNKVVFNESITGSGKLDINNVTQIPTSQGSVTLNANMSNYTGDVTVYEGTLIVGAEMGTGSTADAYTNFFAGSVVFGDVSNATSATLDASNGVLDNFDISQWDTSAGMGLVLDVDLSEQLSDFFDNAGANQIVGIESFALTGDLDQESAYIYISDASEGFYIACLDEEITSEQYSYTVTDVYLEGDTEHEAGYYLYFEKVVIPEPSTATLSLLALTAMLARRRRKVVSLVK